MLFPLLNGYFSEEGTLVEEISMVVYFFFLFFFCVGGGLNIRVPYAYQNTANPISVPCIA